MDDCRCYMGQEVSSKLPISEWDGKSDTVIGVKPKKCSVKEQTSLKSRLRQDIENS